MVCMDGNEESSPTLHVFDNRVCTTSAQVVSRKEHIVVAGLVAQVLDVLFSRVDVAEAARIVGGNGAFDLRGCEAGGLCEGMLVCG